MGKLKMEMRNDVELSRYDVRLRKKSSWDFSIFPMVPERKLSAIDFQLLLYCGLSWSNEGL